MLKARIGAKEDESFRRLAGIRRIEDIEISNLDIRTDQFYKKRKNLTH